MIFSGSRPLPGVIRPRSSRAFTVLRLADAGRISSPSFNRRRTGLPPRESVSSWYPCSMCQIKSCSASVSFGRTAPAFFLAIVPPPNARKKILVRLVRRSGRSCEILWSDLFHIELDGSFAHSLQHLFKRRRFAFDPAQRIDSRHYERPQVGADQTTLFELLHHYGNLLFQVKHHPRTLLMILNCAPQRLISKDFKSPQNRVVDSAAEAWHSFIADTERDQRGFIEIE